MFMLFFTCIDSVGEYRTCSYGGPSLEAGLDLISTLMNDGSQLLGVKLIDDGRRSMELPVEVFDGSSFEDPLSKLQLEWETILMSR